MLGKNWNPTTGKYEVTFDLPGDLDIRRATVVGEFNDWDESATPMSHQDDGRLAATVPLEPGRRYQFRYHLGGDRWENDWNADDYVPNAFGGADSVVEVPDAPRQPPAVKKTSAGRKKSGTKKRAAAKKGAKGAKKAPARRTGTKGAAKRRATKKKPGS